MLIRLFLYSLFVTTPWVVYLFSSVNYYSDFVRSKFQTDLQPDNAVFDFIVVGSGSGGAVVTLRLSTNRNIRILLLEAGGDPSPLNHIPGLAMDMIGYESTDWMHKTVPQKNACFGLKNNQSSWTAGKVLGGSTSLNFMFYLRGHPLDYDNWANITGDKDWAYEKVLPFFTKSIKHYKGRFVNNRKHYSESEYGFLQIEERERAWAPLYNEFIDAGREFGFPEIDVNGGSQTSGFGQIETNQRNGERFGAYSAIIPKLKRRTNVHISKFSRVLKIKFDQNMRAEGVWYLHHGVKKFAAASKEIILSAGSVNSPQILMLSGVGPKAHLESVGIKTKVDLPVGENLHDHLMVPLIPFLIDKPQSFQPDRDFGPTVFLKYLTEGKGPLTTPNLAHSQIFYSSKKVKKSGVDWPDVQSFFSASGPYEMLSSSLIRSIGFREESLKPTIDPYAGRDGFSLFTGLGRPKSRGTIKLQNKNPLQRPLIDPHYLEHRDDIDAIVDGVKTKVNIFENAKAFKAMNTQFGPTPIPGCEAHKLRSDAYWECYVRHWTLTIWHPVGTCKMGRSIGDKTAVVDSKLRVLKTKGLRVIDASIMPVIVNANTMGAVLMIGERGGELIREHWAQEFLVSDLKDRFLFNDNHKCYYSQMI